MKLLELFTKFLHIYVATIQFLLYLNPFKTVFHSDLVYGMSLTY